MGDKWHFIISLIKSIFRIIGFASLWMATPTTAIIILIMA